MSGMGFGIQKALFALRIIRKEILSNREASKGVIFVYGVLAG
jgi:hypothetical protein